MGNNHSYNRLPSSPKSESQRPLLDVTDNQCLEHVSLEQLKRDIDADRKRHVSLEQLKRDIDADRKRHMSMEKKNTALEKEICELRSAMSELQSRRPPIAEIEKKVALQKQQIGELRSVLSRLESKPPLTAPAARGLEKDEALKKQDIVGVLVEKHAELAKKASELTTIVHRLKATVSSNLMKTKDMEKVVKKNGEFADKVMMPIATVYHQLHPASSNSMAASSNSMKKIGSITDLMVPEPEMNDLLSCLVYLLIFLIGMLIGVLLRVI